MYQAREDCYDRGRNIHQDIERERETIYIFFVKRKKQASEKDIKTVIKVMLN